MSVEIVRRRLGRQVPQAYVRAPMTDRPMIFSTQMVRALADGRKTMTRRLRNPVCVAGDRIWVRERWQEFFADGSARWRSPIHMPRLASRFTLTVREVVIERLHDIREADAEAEGVEPILVPPDGGSASHVEGFRKLWNELHGPSAWDANPWVAAIRFTVERRNIDAGPVTEPAETPPP